jgi:hypothetical protein
MIIKNYFTENRGTGVLATADRAGNVNTAIYARPHVFDDATLGFIMRDRLSRKNLLESGHASYLFLENGGSYKGLRLKLKFLDESTDPELLSRLSRRSQHAGNSTPDEQRFLVKFMVERGFSLIGGEDVEIQ